MANIPEEAVSCRWFQVRAARNQRTPARVLQILDVQACEPEQLEFERSGDALLLRFAVHCDAAKANRIGQLLRRAEWIQSAVWVEESMRDSAHSDERPATSLWSANEPQPDEPETSSFWLSAPTITMRSDPFGRRLDGHNTEIRSRWTDRNLHLLFVCPFDELHLGPQPPLLHQPTQELWNYDVAEVFIGGEEDYGSRYLEFEVSPRGEWIDLAIDCVEDAKVGASSLSSGFGATARIEDGRWLAWMRIPLAVLGPDLPADSAMLRVNFFRSQGPRPVELAWQAPHNTSFHVPRVFGKLHLVR